MTSQYHYDWFILDTVFHHHSSTAFLRVIARYQLEIPRVIFFFRTTLPYPPGSLRVRPWKVTFPKARGVKKITLLTLKNIDVFFFKAFRWLPFSLGSLLTHFALGILNFHPFFSHESDGPLKLKLKKIKAFVGNIAWCQIFGAWWNHPYHMIFRSINLMSCFFETHPYPAANPHVVVHESFLLSSVFPASQERLRRLVAPFLMRRLKGEVAKDLPDKVEQVPPWHLEGVNHGRVFGGLQLGW